MGSIDFFAVARSVLLVGRIEGQENTRAVVQIKNNLAAFGHSKAFELMEEGFQWLGDYEIPFSSARLTISSLFTTLVVSASS